MLATTTRRPTAETRRGGAGSPCELLQLLGLLSQGAGVGPFRARRLQTLLLPLLSPRARLGTR